ncbi:transcriptional regulator [Escherichia coli]|nr:transcriptional regulator [Escherichia coli]
MQETIAEGGVFNAGGDDTQLQEKEVRNKLSLRLDGPVADLVFLDKGAAYVGLTRKALATALRRGEMPGHKKRKNPEDETSRGVWIFNVKAWNELADILPEIEPPEWHHWKDYWLYNRNTRKFQKIDKQDCTQINGKRVYRPRQSRLEKARQS